MIPKYKIATTLLEDNQAVAVVKLQIEFELTIGPELVQSMVSQVKEGLHGALHDKPTAAADFSFVNEMLEVIEQTTSTMATIRNNAAALGGQALEDYRKLASTYERDWISADTDVSFDAIASIHRSCAAFQAVRIEGDCRTCEADIIYSAGFTQYRRRVTAENVDEKIAQLDQLQERILKAEPDMKGGKLPGKLVGLLTILQAVREMHEYARDSLIPDMKVALEKLKKALAEADEQRAREASERDYRRERDRLNDAAERGGYFREQRGRDLYIT